MSAAEPHRLPASLIVLGLVALPSSAAWAGPRISLDTLPAAVSAIDPEDIADHDLSITDVVGQIHRIQTSNPGRPHVVASGQISTGDYFRGVYDGDPDDLDQVNFTGTLIGAVEIIRDGSGAIYGANAVAGVVNSIAERPDEVFTDALWYRGDHFGSIVLELPSDLTGAVTYTVFDSPSGELANSEEVSASLAYFGDNTIGWLRPQVQAAVRTRGFTTGDWFAQGSIAPVIQPMDGSPLRLQFPVTVGVGLDDYYGPNIDTPVFVIGGVTALWPIEQLDPGEWGVWTLSAGVDLMWRDDELTDLDPNYADGNDFTVFGKVGLSVAF